MVGHESELEYGTVYCEFPETGIPENVLNGKMKFAKGAAQGSLSREAVDWMVRTADLTTFIAQWNNGVSHINSMIVRDQITPDD